MFNRNYWNYWIYICVVNEYRSNKMARPWTEGRSSRTVRAALPDRQFRLQNRIVYNTKSYSFARARFYQVIQSFAHDVGAHLSVAVPSACPLCVLQNDRSPCANATDMSLHNATWCLSATLDLVVPLFQATP